MERVTPEIAALFRKSFAGEPPSYPRHFAAFYRNLVAGYVHFTAWQPGIYLIGGLCVEAALYRRMTAAERRALAGEGSLSRSLSKRSIAALGPKRAVFAFTGDVRSRRDSRALGFEPTNTTHLYVQWHDEPAGSRADVVRAVSGLGPF